MAIRGERGLIDLPAEWLLRMRYNPFYAVLEERVLKSFAAHGDTSHATVRGAIRSPAPAAPNGAKDRRLFYTAQRVAPDWILLHRIGPLGEYDSEIERGGRPYQLARVAPYSDLSGWHWLAYRRQPPTP